jgi:integrase
MSDMTLTAVLKRMGHSDITVHGFRSTFRDWAAEISNYPHEVAEMALAHSVGNKVEASYRRGDLLGKRFAMMNEWAEHCFNNGDK